MVPNLLLKAVFCSDPNAVVEIGNVDRNLVQEFINAAEKILHPFFDVSLSVPQGFSVLIKNIFIAAR